MVNSNLRFFFKFQFIIILTLLVSCQSLDGKTITEQKPDSTAETENNFVTKTSGDVFGKWIEIQEKRTDYDLNRIKGSVDKKFVEVFMEKMQRDILIHIAFLFPRTTVYKELSPKEIEWALNNLEKMRGYLENDIAGFVDYLIFNKFTSFEISMLDEWEVNNGSITVLYKKYRSFIETLLHDIEFKKQYSVLNSVANRFFEYCFYPSTFNHFQNILKNKENLPVARFLYEVIWYYLARGEWYAWHKNTLFNLKREHDQGKEVVYIAGGNDIFQLISEGIYNIRNIDPIYPTQTRYYSEGWDFLAIGTGENNGIGDTIIFDDPLNAEKNIVMRRITYEETGVIAASIEIEDKLVKIPESITVWSIETKDGEKLGKYTLERRFVEQNDFKVHPDRSLVISFNELYFIMTASDENWGIDPRKFSRNIIFHVKQLRAPINHKVLMNIRTIQESDFPNRFGSSVVDD